VPVVFLIAIVMVLVGIFFAATGRGGELAYEHADHAPLDLGPVSAADIALLRPPTAMWGYNMQVTDAALDKIAQAMRQRDVTIAYLQEQLTTYERNGSSAIPRGAHARQASGTPEPDALDPPGVFDPPGALDTLGFPETSSPPTNPDLMEPLATLEPPESSATLDPLESPEALQSPEPPEPLETPGTLEPLDSPEPFTAAEPPAAAATTTQDPGPPRTPLVLKASGPRPDPHEATQPSQTLQDPGESVDATEPTEVYRADEDPREATHPSATQPSVTPASATLAPDDPPGPQGAFDTHGWWAEQQQAARDERERRHAAGEQDDESVAAAEEQSW
jgi:hypothetical protein